MAALDLWNVAHSISAQIRSLFSQEIRLVLGVKAELQKLRTAVSAIITSGLLREFEDRRFEAESVKDWFVKLGDALHDADRLLDDIRTEVFRRRVMGGDKRILNEVRIFFSSSNQLLYAIKMAHRVKEVRERIDATWHDRFLFQLEGNSNLIGSLVENRVMRETYPYDPQPYVIGRDKDKNEVIEFLLTDFDENVTVLPIVGIGGLGKTTLARLVFNDMCVKQHFELKLWVCISANFDVQNILRKILRECIASEELNANLDMHELQKKGFIKHRGSSMNTIEEVGYNYFTELLSRSFFQDIEEDLYGNIVRCKMHVLMHELAQFVAGNVCITIDSSNAIKFQGGVRHVSIIATEDYEWNGFERDRTVRSLFLIAGKRISIGHLDFSYFRNLRALRLQDVVWDVTSQSIGELKHLRSLDLSKNDKLSYLPNSVSNLCNLERLNLRECHRLQELPRGITRLVNLRHLEVSGCSRLMHLPSGIEKLTSLQTLDMFVVGEKQNSHAARFNEMSRLTRLRKQLTIQHLERLESISGEVDAFFSMEKFVLQCLELHWDTNVVMANAGEVLERLRPRRNLEGLKIAVGDAKHLPVELFQSLPSLECLAIKRCPCLKDPSVRTILRCLTALKMLEISDCRALDLSTENGDHSDDDDDENLHARRLNGHSKLQHIHIRGIHKMESLAGWFQYLSNLQGLRISLCLWLKSLPSRVILRLLKTVRSLELRSCPEFDLTGQEQEDQEDMPNWQSYGPTEL
ncbi:hypothetical protein CRG98_045624 [Punica granatum]|uniref:Disease resistance protein RGA3 n=1 Tax=Punica granatum TaxID=22663 RepID=A0A2I0HRY0_PUNGR|nr:hypothetical protein CRG98_045624 [Punica granatum]